MIGLTAAWGAAFALASSIGWATEASGRPPSNLRLAVFPVSNLTNSVVPLPELRAAIVRSLSARGIGSLEDEAVSAFISRHRIRWVGGIEEALGRALSEETGADAVLVTSLDLFDAGEPPRIGFTMRLAVTGAKGVRVAWATSVASTGYDHPGFLELGVVHDPSVLITRAIDEATLKLASFLDKNGTPPAAAPPRAERRFRPRVFHAVSASAVIGREAKRIAVLPFINESVRRYAGEIVAEHFVTALVEAGGLEVVEPGVVRKVLIETRLIQKEGLTFEQAELLRERLDVDLVVAGRSFDFGEPLETDQVPRVEFTSAGIDTRRRQVGWVAFSHAKGTDGVFFFGLRTIRTAGGLTDGLVRGVLHEAMR